MGDELLVLISGINIGLRFLLFTLAFVLIFRVWDFLNIWHVSAVTMGTYLVYYFSDILDFNLGLSIFITIIIVIALGMMVARYLYYPLRGSRVSLLILSMGLGFLTNSALELLFGPAPVAYVSPVLGVSFLGCSLMEYIISAVALISIFLLWYFLNRTRRGAAIESFTDNPTLATLRGVNPRFVFIVTWTIALFLTAIAGILIGWVQTLVPKMGWQLLPIVFAVTILGRRSLRGIFLSSLTIGIVMSFGVYFFVPEAYQLAIVFAIVVITLVVSSKYHTIKRNVDKILKYFGIKFRTR